MENDKFRKKFGLDSLITSEKIMQGLSPINKAINLSQKANPFIKMTPMLNIAEILNSQKPKNDQKRSTTIARDLGTK